MTPWKWVMMLLIGKLILPNHPIFYRSDLIKQENQDAAVSLLHKIFKYKEHPEKVEQTMQHVLQRLRDDGYVKFYTPERPAKYELTNKGYKKLAEIQEEIKKEQ